MSKVAVPLLGPPFPCRQQGGNWGNDQVAGAEIGARGRDWMPIWLLVIALLACPVVPATAAHQGTSANEPERLGFRPARFLPKEEREEGSRDAPQSERASQPPSARSDPDDPLASEAYRNDATLVDVFFVDRQRGWAVGDRGTIWHTRDAGRHWVLQHAGVNCRLESVWFMDPQVGWAAGGFTHPYTHTGSGVLLFTDDGGAHWHRHTKLLIPPLRRVQFFGPRSGVALGLPSALFGSGVFTSANGGRSWEPVPGKQPHGPLLGDFLTGALGAVYSVDGPAVVADRQMEKTPGVSPLTGENLPPRSPVPAPFPARLRLTWPNGGWLVGPGGMVLRTADQGRSWHLPPGPLPPGSQQFDFAAVEVRGPRCWIAGYPGTHVFFTPDAGHTWSAFATGQTIPLQAICFVDDQFGWAVGDLGTILATTDGGRTWSPQRFGGKRVALLAILSEPSDIPWELLARVSGNDGYLAAVELINRRDLETPGRDEVPLGWRVHEAVVRTGGCAGRLAWQFPLRQPGLEMPMERIAAIWDELHSGRGREALEAYLVRAIRTWQPDVLLTHDSATPRPAAQLLAQAVSRAVALAGGPPAGPQQAESLALGPWEVKRVFAICMPGTQGAFQVNDSQWADRLGCSLGDLAFPARSLVHDEFVPSPVQQGFRLLTEHRGDDGAARDLFDRVVMMPGGEARRALPAASPETGDLMRRMAQRRRSTLAIIQQSGQAPTANRALAAEIRPLLDDLDGQAAARVLYMLAQSYYRSGHAPLAAEMLEMLCQSYEEEPLARPAKLWLLQYHASSETRWHIERRGWAGRRADWPQAGPLPGAVQQASAWSGSGEEGAPRRERAAALGTHLQQTRPDLFAQPQIGFPLAAAGRADSPRHTERFYAMWRNSPIHDAWWACAQTELWLADPRGTPPKPLYRCPRATAKPYLDGNLDDPIWQTAPPAPLHSLVDDDRAWPATVRIAWDREFLYLAVEARQVPGPAYERTPGPRRRDAELGSHDRIEFYLDLDRDYVTYYRLAIDHRGWTAEDCWGDATWNPTWFVAAQSEGGYWRIEAAIPLDQLAGDTPQPGTAWALGIQRIIPTVGFQSWNRPAAVHVIPEGFGCLLFE